MKRPRPPRSVRMRITLWYAGALALALLAYAGFVFVVLWRILSTDLDRRLQADVDLAEGKLELRNGQLVWEDNDPGDPAGREEIPRVGVLTKTARRSTAPRASETRTRPSSAPSAASPAWSICPRSRSAPSAPSSRCTANWDFWPWC